MEGGGAGREISEVFLSLSCQRPRPQHGLMRMLFSLELQSFVSVKVLQDGPYTRHIQQVRLPSL